jgi:hypothetical protein
MSIYYSKKWRHSWFLALGIVSQIIFTLPIHLSMDLFEYKKYPLIWFLVVKPSRQLIDLTLCDFRKDPVLFVGIADLNVYLHRNLFHIQRNKAKKRFQLNLILKATAIITRLFYKECRNPS